ncbi:myb-related transcription factor, partner of profilin-like [Dreissena polymorpha]|uniref:myb-related transcription factor, partner of profilin-like n=1 Tax=Dreissena polymorpha TaxID=45954 RepID=UPI0022655349|nr:myb-related transcription factor, partner of profilin-like [Dreissena polymorpha]
MECLSEENVMKRQKAPDWTEPAEIVLNALVRDHWNLLFGDYKGIGAEKISVLRRKKWDEIGSRLSLEFGVARTGEQCRKKFQNSKARYIKKVGEMRHPTTGGGDAVQLTSSEEVLASTMQGHPVVQGLTGGVDSDVVASQTRIWALATGSNPEQKEQMTVDTQLENKNDCKL